MGDAYNGQFHHDWARNKGSAAFTYKFMPPVDGCYSIEEYHPGKNPACSRYLPRNAQLDIDYCKGKSAGLRINQAINGGQWNEIVSGLMFFKGIEGRLKMRSSAGEVCSDRNCFWVTDAFRLIYKGPTCRAVYAQARKDEAIPARNDEAIKQSQKVSLSASGSVMLALSLGNGLEKDGVMVKLQYHKTHLEKTFAMHLGYKSASILGMAASARRLQETSGTSPLSLKVRFSAQEKIREPSAEEAFKQALQANLNTIVPGVTLEDISMVEWADLASAESESKAGDGTDFTLYVAVAAATSLLILCTCLGWKYLQSRRGEFATKKIVEAQQVKPSDEICTVVASENVKLDLDLEKAEKMDNTETASTGTPASEPPSSLDGANSETNSRQDDTEELTPTIGAVPAA